MKLVIGNQKSYMNKADVESFINETKDNIFNRENVIICPSDIYISSYIDNNYRTGGQNVSLKMNGPTTGEVSAQQLKSVGVTYCVVGHSERRKDNSETDIDTNIKIKNLLAEQLIPILCVGESREERENGLCLEVISREINTAFKDLSSDQAGQIIVAYEPVWAISDGINPASIPTNEEIKEIVLQIKDYVMNNNQVEVKVLYGGSVNDKNIDELNLIIELDGYLIGGASKNAKEFNYIINSTK